MVVSEVNLEVDMLICIRRPDKALNGTQLAEDSGISSPLSPDPTGILYGQQHEVPHFMRINRMS
ncbi:hypothetical protein SBDP1_270044 [Syntrophobacter sp. SbD1]|nr:hypothetical protein SBDP1_270044 [Syntrophobacter sp. SbD1]